MEEIRNLLDNLMGTDRNETVGEGGTPSRELEFWAVDICKHYLVGLCPHELFRNTRSDLGPCARIHSEQKRTIYNEYPAAKRQQYAVRYENDAISFLQRLIRQVESKIQRGNERIDAPLPSEQELKFEELPDERKQKIAGLNAQISQLIQQGEEAGAEGKIDEAEAITRQGAYLRHQVQKLHSNSSNYDLYVQRDKALQVCRVCGAMQSAADSANRFESHVFGKQHIGFEQVRNQLEELLKRRGERTEKKRLECALARAVDSSPNQQSPSQGHSPQGRTPQGQTPPRQQRGGFRGGRGSGPGNQGGRGYGHQGGPGHGHQGGDRYRSDRGGHEHQRKFDQGRGGGYNQGGYRPGPDQGGYRPGPDQGGYRPGPDQGGYRPGPDQGGYRRGGPARARGGRGGQNSRPRLQDTWSQNGRDR